MTHFSWIDYTAFGLYLLATAAIGLAFSRGQKDVKEYLLASRSIGSVVLSMTVLAAFFSGISFLAAPSETYTNGIGFFVTMVSFFIATPFTATFILPFFYNSRFFTAYQYLDERFDGRIRMLASGSFILRVTLWLAAATYAPALALEQVTGLPLWFTILCTGIVTTIYTTFGGMRAVIWTDVMQLLVLFGGMVVIMFTAVGQLPEGWSQVVSTAQKHHLFDLNWSLDPTVRITVWAALIGGAVMNLVQMASDQVAVQRYLTAKSYAEAKRGLWIKLWLTLPVTAVFYGTGLVLFGFYQMKGDPVAAGLVKKADTILPFFVVNELPMGFAGLFIAAIYAASMSTISAGINSLTSATLIDFYQKLIPGLVNDEPRQMRLSRWLTAFYGSAVIAFAFLVHRLGTLLEATNKVISLVGGPLLGLFFLGMFTTRTNARGALWGWAAGFLTLLCVSFGKSLASIAPGPLQGVFTTLGSLSFLWWTFVGITVTMTVGLVASRFGPAPSSEQLKDLTWSQLDQIKIGEQ